MVTDGLPDTAMALTRAKRLRLLLVALFRVLHSVAGILEVCHQAALRRATE